MVASGAAMATPPSSPYLREAAQIIQDVSDVVPDFKKGHGRLGLPFSPVKSMIEFNHLLNRGK